ncbi:YlxM family DNA-binding protein [Fusobacterium sp. MFO224]|uniref:YlxM family DNA-binding protein n=1 Tax=Fusobacterium sp. MFO224 TaxID=3378070 RepID=UPI003854B634
MELNEIIEIGILLEYYKPLLSEKQRKYLVGYFDEDLSFTEIAEENGITRQAVHDNIKRGIKILKTYEEKLGFYKKDRKIYDKLLKLREDFKKENLENIIEELS